MDLDHLLAILAIGLSLVFGQGARNWGSAFFDFWFPCFFFFGTAYSLRIFSWHGIVIPMQHIFNDYSLDTVHLKSWAAALKASHNGFYLFYTLFLMGTCRREGKRNFRG